MVDKGLPWSGERSYFLDTGVQHFRMPSEPTLRCALTLDIQHYYVEQFAHHAVRCHDGLVDVRYSS